MQKTFRLFISLLLALLLTAQCFAAAVPLDAAEDPAAPDEAAPQVTSAEVRPAESETASALTDGAVLEYNAAVFHFVLEDPAPESDGEQSGMDLEHSAVYLDGCRMAAAADAEDSSLSLSVTLPNGRHVLRVLARDNVGNESETCYALQIAGKNLTFPVYSVTADRDYAPLGSTLTLAVHTSDAAYLSVVHGAMQISPAFADAFTVSAGQGFALQEQTYDAATGTLRFTVKANTTLSGARDAALITFAVDRTLPEGTVLTYAVPGVWAETRRENAEYLESFTQSEQSIPVSAPLVVTADDVYAGMTEDAYFHIKDANGSPVREANVLLADGTLLGRANWSGLLKIPANLLQASGVFTVYAQKEGVGASFPCRVTVTAPAGADEESGVTFRPVSGTPTSKTVTWLSGFHDTVWLRYAETMSALTAAEALKADYTRVPAGEKIVQVNRITLTGLTPDRTCYLQTSYDGENWSAVRSFAAADLSTETRFFLLGSLTEDGEERTQLLQALAAEDLPLGVVSGGLVTDAAALSQWLSAASALADLGDPDLIFAPAASDVSDGGAAFSGVSGQPDGCSSVSTGLVYLAVLPDRDDAADLTWLSQDAARSACPWKIVVTSRPVDEALSQAAERAGIQFVFSGSDPRLARTPALLGGAAAESYDVAAHSSLRGDGVVYWLCGCAGSFAAPEQALPEQYDAVFADHTGVYLTAEVTQDRFVVRALDAEGKELDRYTVLDSSCVDDGHIFSEESHYDPAADTIVCDRCGRAVPAVQSGYTGFAALDNGRAYLERGFVRTGWFTAKGVLYHAGEDARIHQTVAFSTETCTEPGERMAWCTECRETHSQGVSVPASGHSYDSNHHCQNLHFDAAHRTIQCGWTAENLADQTAELSYLYGYYTGEALTPAVKLTTADGAEIPPEEYTVSYADNVRLGVATVTVKAANSYYGEVTLRFEIRPDEVKTITASDVTSSGLTLSWEAAAGAARYAVYQQTGENWKRLGDTADTHFAVTDLQPGLLYSFRIRPFATVTDTARRLDGSTDRTYWAPHYSAVLSVKTQGIAFIDVPAGAWFAPAVDWAVANSVTNGTGGQYFSPNEHCTRGQMVTFLWRAKGCPEPKQTFSPFEDVADPAAYYYKAVLWAVEQGITRGSSATTFSPDAPVTRGMVVTFLHRAAGDQPPRSSASPFVDVPAGQYYAESVQWALEQKITTGTDATHFAPDQICTRAEIVTFLWRFETNA